MPDRAGFPAGVPCYIDLSPPDPEAATGFYGPLFGWTFEDRMPPEAPGHFFAARLGDREVTAISSAPGDAATPPAWTTWLLPLEDDDAAPHCSVTFAVAGTDAVADRAAELGGAILAAPFDAGPARVAVLRDPLGAEFTVSTYAPHG